MNGYDLKRLERKVVAISKDIKEIKNELGLDKLERIRAVVDYTSADPRVALEEIRLILAE